MDGARNAAFSHFLHDLMQSACALHKQLRWVCPKRWQRLHCSRPSAATCDSTDNSQAAEFGEWSHFPHLRPSRHRNNEVGVGGRSLTGSRSRRPDRSSASPWARMFMYLSSCTTLSGIHLPKCLTISRTQREREDVEAHTLPHIEGPVRWSRLDLLPVDGTTINFSPFSWGRQTARARRPQPGQEGTGVTDSCNKNGPLIRTLSCW